MGNKPSNNFQQDRPESGGADRDDEREASGLLDKAKQEFAESQAKKHPASQADRAAPPTRDGERGKNKSP